MIRVMVVSSSYSKVPLAEVRTDGRSVDFVVDNTNGMLPSSVGNRYDKLMEIVNSSRYLSIADQEKPTVNLIRYLLSDHRVVEITSDGLTCLVDGKLISEKEKQDLFLSIKNKQISIKSRQNDPVPVQAPPKVKQPAVAVKQVGDMSSAIQDVLRTIKEKQTEEKRYNRYWDGGIEDADLSDSDDPKESKSFMYFMKYGQR